MLDMIWKLIGPVLVDLALRVGLPKAIEWLTSKGLPQWLVTSIEKFLESALGGIIKEAHAKIEAFKADSNLSPQERADKVKAVRIEAKGQAQKHCDGIGCAPEIKEL